eukprot:CAMPEP_0174750324 /NCGR_PEP_ID=MMETSP1094-20130205/97479_1 /TAXON_ID=156173 /ORGANISM="Chrysochromulina brevifilum, Strain UTEX LB 985" /LENGTH=58 /DNA_ID=CAMNT_0015955655 /DNA_START=131 /DNA_END=307 /DNA_ORIENTATION=-
MKVMSRTAVDTSYGVPAPPPNGECLLVQLTAHCLAPAQRDRHALHELKALTQAACKAP